MAKPKRMRIAAIAMAAVIASSLSFPAPALAQVTFDGNELANGTNSVGGGTATLSDTSLDMNGVTGGSLYTDESLAINFNGGNSIDKFTVGGDANACVDFSGSNAVEDTYVTDNANVTIHANGHNDFEEVNASDNANVTIKVTGENNFESIEGTGNSNITIQGTDCQKRDIVNVGASENDENVTTENGDLIIDHVTMNLKDKEATVGSYKGNLVIDTSKIADDDDNEWTEIIAGGAMLIKESVIDIKGTVYSDGLMTIEHSDVKVKKPDSKYDKRPYRVFSKTGIVLIREKNGEVKEGEYDGHKVWYVDTDDDNDDDSDDVDLKADGEPEYYTCKAKKAELKAMSASPATGDPLNPLVFALVALMSASTAGYASLLRRKENSAFALHDEYTD